MMFANLLQLLILSGCEQGDDKGFEVFEPRILLSCEPKTPTLFWVSMRINLSV